MATIGQQLLTPDVGYQRIDITTTNVTTNMANGAIPESLNGNAIYAGVIGGYARFNIYTSKLRIISMGHPTGNSNAKLYADGKLITTMNNSTASRTGFLLVADVFFESKKEVSIDIEIDTDGEFEFDAIDIDSDGQLLNYNPYVSKTKNNIGYMQIGDRISFEYTASTSGAIGSFANLGSATKTEIPVGSTGLPDGKAYFIHSGYDSQGRIKLVADRNIQNVISWDKLNASGFVNGISMSIGATTGIMRLLSGGLSSSDTENEWDKIIVNSSLNGTINPGSDSVWHWQNIYSWTSTYVTAGGVIRGYSASSYNYGGFTVTTAQSNVGWRPMFLVTPSNTRYLFSIAGAPYTWNGSAIVSVADFSSSTFQTSGVTEITQSMLSALKTAAGNNATEVYVYSPDTVPTAVTISGTPVYPQIVLGNTDYTTTNLKSMVASADAGIILSYDSGATWVGPSGSVTPNNPASYWTSATLTNLSIPAGKVRIGLVFNSAASTFDSVVYNANGSPGTYTIALNGTQIKSGTNAAEISEDTLVLNADLSATNTLTVASTSIAGTTNESYALTKYSNTSSEVIRSFYPWDGGYTQEGRFLESTELTRIDATKFSSIQGITGLDLFAAYIQFSDDNKATWKKYDGTSFVTVDKAIESNYTTVMSYTNVLNSLTQSAFTGLNCKGYIDFRIAPDKAGQFKVTFAPNQPPTYTTPVVSANQAHAQDVTITTTVSDTDGDQIRYRVDIDGVQGTWSALQDAPYSLSYTIPVNSLTLDLDKAYTIVLEDALGNTTTIPTIYVRRVNASPTFVSTEASNHKFSGSIADPDSDKVRYRLLLNGTEVIPMTALTTSPLAIDVPTPRNLVNIGAANTWRIEFEDELGKAGTSEFSFTGDYAGLMFRDSSGTTYYSDEDGTVLVTLNLGTLNQGDAKDYQFQVINKTGATLDTITLETQSAPTGITVDYGAAIVGPIGNGATVTINAQVRVGADGGSGTIVTKATGVKN